MDNNRHYNQQSKYFDNEFSNIKRYTLAAWQTSFIERIKDNLLDSDYKNKTLLDVATGSGYVAVEMAKLGMNVIACDLSTQALENLKKYKEEFKLSNLKLIQCNVDNIPLGDSSVDYLVANAILEHLPNDKKAIECWKKKLKRGGKFFINVPLKLKFVWPFFWIPCYIHDRKIGHLRRYDLKTLLEDFRLPIEKYFYTGHLIKSIIVIFSRLFKSTRLDRYAERIDHIKEHNQYGSHNISVIMTTTTSV